MLIRTSIDTFKLLESNLKRELSLFLEKSREELLEEFYSVKTPRDVAALVDVPYKRLVYHLYKNPSENRYENFQVPKRNGSSRNILAPINGLKIIQRKLSQVLYYVYQPKPSVHGFCPARSIVTNASLHVNKRLVFNIDLKDFFPSISFARIRGLFMASPYNLPPEAATVLAQICCHKDQLPQGAPTSPIVSNMICAKMDRQLQQLAKECRSTYTRYADDITFSTTLARLSDQIVCLVEESDEDKLLIGEKLTSIITNNGFYINEQKIRLQDRKTRQEVTGLTVNKFPNIERKYIRQVRAMLHAWEKFGLEAAEKVYLEKYTSSSKYPSMSPAPFKQVLRGKIEFIRAVRGRENQIYQNYLKKYRELSKKIKKLKN